MKWTKVHSWQIPSRWRRWSNTSKPIVVHSILTTAFVRQHSLTYERRLMAKNGNNWTECDDIINDEENNGKVDLWHTFVVVDTRKMDLWGSKNCWCHTLKVCIRNIFYIAFYVLLLFQALGCTQPYVMSEDISSVTSWQMSLRCILIATSTCIFRKQISISNRKRVRVRVSEVVELRVPKRYNRKCKNLMSILWRRRHSTEFGMRLGSICDLDVREMVFPRFDSWSDTSEILRDYRSAFNFGWHCAGTTPTFILPGTNRGVMVDTEMSKFEKKKNPCLLTTFPSTNMVPNQRKHHRGNW